MTEEESFKVYIKRELCAHCRFPQLCKGEEDCSDIANAKRHYLAGVEGTLRFKKYDSEVEK